MHIFYQPNLSSPQILLSEEESKHAVRVLRLKKGDEVHLADGRGMHAVASIIDDNPKKCLLDISSKNIQPQNRSYHLHILVAPTKNFDRIEWFLEKATEIGIDEISFIETENSERSKVNMERCEKISISAMKQSKQWFLPLIHDVVKLPTLLQQNKMEGTKLVAWCETNQTAFITQQLSKQTSTIHILIGPEGDFTAAEISLAQQAGFIPVSLGESILRTETAALFACMSVKTILSSN